MERIKSLLLNRSGSRVPRRRQYVQATAGFQLKAGKDPVKGSQYSLISDQGDATYPIDDKAALVWQCCHNPMAVEDLVELIAAGTRKGRDIEQDVPDILQQLGQLGLISIWYDPYPMLSYFLEYEPIEGKRSAKAQRLAEFCLGEFTDKQPAPCSGDIDYQVKNRMLMLETGPNRVSLSSGRERPRSDTKKVVDALISQRAAIPPGLRCWLVRGDNAGRKTLAEHGLHISGMRRSVHRHIVLVPSACRNRYLGPNLERQMEELQESWVPWEQKSDTAWWGGALTGDWWRKNEPRTLTRREVLVYFRDNPSERVRLDLTQVPSSTTPPDGVAVKNCFTKRHAFGHKCLLLLPGNDIASGSSWYFAGNSVVMMPTPHMEHILYFELKPWEHYVPLERDPADILVKLDWVLENQDKAREIVLNAHEHLRWLCGEEYLWACNEVLRRLAQSPGHGVLG